VHLPVTTRGASGARRNLLNGHIGIAYEDISQLCVRLASVEDRLSQTSFAWCQKDEGTVSITDPMGNRWVAEQKPESTRDTRGHHPGGLSTCMGITHIEFSVPLNTTGPIAEYYRRYFDAVATAGGGLATVKVGPKQELRFRESPNTVLGPPDVAYQNQIYGLHIALYLYDQLTPMQKLATDNLLWGNPRFLELDTKLGLSQFRCKDIMMQIASTREPVLLCELEHEVRTREHASSPFGRMQPYLLEGREPVRELITAVVPDEEGRDIEFERRQHMKRKQGYVPRPLGVCYKPIEFFTWDTPNGKKISILMEELKLPYIVHAINLKEGDQHTPEFRAVSPLGKIPAIRDPNQGENGQTVTIFESGAILVYLAERYGRGQLMPKSAAGKVQCMEWLFFQMSGFGPTAGQVHHFAGLPNHEDQEANPVANYGYKRFSNEVRQQYGVMDAWLAEHEYFAGHCYTIADIAIFPWVWRSWRHKVELADFPNVKSWFERISARRAVVAGLQVPGGTSTKWCKD